MKFIFFMLAAILPLTLFAQKLEVKDGFLGDKVYLKGQKINLFETLEVLKENHFNSQDLEEAVIFRWMGHFSGLMSLGVMGYTLSTINSEKGFNSTYLVMSLAGIGAHFFLVRKSNKIINEELNKFNDHIARQSNFNPEIKITINRLGAGVVLTF